MTKPLLRLLTFVLILPSLAFSSPWIPKYQSLFVDLGFQYLSSSENFNSDGQLIDPSFSGTTTKFRETSFYLKPEYGFSKDMSIALSMELVLSNVDDSSAGGGGLLSSTALGDIVIAWKYQAKQTGVILTPEVAFVIPTYSNNPLDPNDLIPGDGNYDLHIRLHSGYKKKKGFLQLSPALIFRFGDYASAFQIYGAAGSKVGPLVGRAFFDYYTSFSTKLLFDSSLNNHNAIGTGGSYMRLAGSPTLFKLGFSLGAEVARGRFIDFNFQHSLAGTRAPHFWAIGLQFKWIKNFYKEEKKIKLKQVPLREDDI